MSFSVIFSTPMDNVTGTFSATLPDILRKHGVTEEEFTKTLQLFSDLYNGSQKKPVKLSIIFVILLCAIILLLLVGVGLGIAIGSAVSPYAFIILGLVAPFAGVCMFILIIWFTFALMKTQTNFENDISGFINMENQKYLEKGLQVNFRSQENGVRVGRIPVPIVYYLDFSVKNEILDQSSVLNQQQQ